MAASSLQPRVRTTAAILVAAGLILIAVATAHAIERAWWDSTEFQVINLDPVPATFAAQFIDISGTLVYSFTDTLPPLGTRFFSPGEMDPPLDPLFSGTLTLDSAQNIAATVLHRDVQGGPLLDGNTTFDVVDDLQLGPLVQAPGSTAAVFHTQFPVDVCTILIIQNPATVTNGAMTYIFDSQGELVGQKMDAIGPGAAVAIRLIDLVPTLLHGGGLVESVEPVRVTLVRSCLGLVGASAYTPLPAAATTWFVPQFFPASLGLGRASYLNLKNASYTEPVEVTVSCPCGITETYVLPPNSGAQVLGPSGAAIGPMFVDSTGPIVASVLTEWDLLDEAQDPGGDYMYSAFDPTQATTAVALPVLLRDYNGWSTDSGIFVQNLGLKATVMHMRVVTVDGQVSEDTGMVAPGMVWTPLPPPIGYQHAAATVWADQPIMALVTLRKEGLLDGWMGYRGVNFVREPPRLLFYLPVILKTG